MTGSRYDDLVPKTNDHCRFIPYWILQWLKGERAGSGEGTGEKKSGGMMEVGGRLLVSMMTSM